MGKLLAKLTGGRPMKRVGFAFYDQVSGVPVHYWVDHFGRYWLAEGSCSIFRVPAGNMKNWVHA